MVAGFAGREWQRLRGGDFRFQKQTLGWELVEPAAIPAVDELLKDAVARLDPVEFNPTFYQATAGFAFRF